tara:strand:+ start:881 stop:1138 length:258 start_codon:yes stop_codon:yes gene_type:complete
MSQNKEEIKNKIIYRSSYRGTKEMDILMTNFVRTIINDLDINQLKLLDEFVNLDDEVLKSIKNRESKIEINQELFFIIKKFQSFS